MADGAATAAGSVITAEMRASIGKKGKPFTVEVEKGAIRKFAEAIGDPNPLWNDESKARKSRYGGMVASPTFLCSIVGGDGRPMALPYPRILNGGNEWEYFQPVRAGDKITAVSKIADMYERKGAMGNMFFLVTETSYTNQLGEKVAIGRNTLISY